MKFFSFKILILCILFPPVLYIFTAQSIERHFQAKYTGDVQEIYLGDTRSLFNGSIKLKDAINKNIDLYLLKNALVSLGMKVSIIVTTKRGNILYPVTFEEEETALLSADPMEIASQNYNLMNEGFEINVDVKLDHNTLISNAILSFYIILSLLMLYYYYVSGLKKAKQEDLAKSEEIEKLREQEKSYTERLKVIERDRGNLTAKFAGIKQELENEKHRSGKNEEEMIEEIVLFEEEIEKNLALQTEQQELIDALKEEIKAFESEKQRDDKQRLKASDSIRKRFNTLYKNIDIHDRAISGYVDISDDLKIKAEEIIHQLNENPKIVQIKRKVFSKKGKGTVLEVLFAYKGRLYFRNTKENKTEVLVIGTKNTQVKDLEFLDNL